MTRRFIAPLALILLTAALLGSLNGSLRAQSSQQGQGSVTIGNAFMIHLVG